jgi:glycerophosphoryl diester phosphodiesterase
MAHRGNRVACPENTLAAFRRALADGADILETDLRVSQDGAFVCIHDSTVNRTTDGRGAVAKMTLAALKQLRADCGRPAFNGERIPTLAEVAAILPPEVGLALELKTARFLEPDVCQRLAGVRARFTTGC